MIKFLTTILLTAGTFSALAQVACPSFEIAIDASLKEIAQNYSDSMFETSAIRAAYQQSKISNELALININVALMAQNKCAPLKAPPTFTHYLPDATQCGTALVQREKNPPACDRKNWKQDK